MKESIPRRHDTTVLLLCLQRMSSQSNIEDLSIKEIRSELNDVGVYHQVRGSVVITLRAKRRVSGNNFKEGKRGTEVCCQLNRSIAHGEHGDMV